jgi:hypothetical protein
MLVRGAPAGNTKVPGLVYIASDGEDERSINQFLGAVRDAVRVVVYPCGVGETPWDKSFWKDTLRNAMHVGQTVDSIRLAHVISAIAKAREQAGVDPARVMVAGRGISGALGLYAAILDPSIQQVMLLDPPSTHAEGPIFLNIMRYTDLPEAAALIAPRRLLFYARTPSAYEYTRGIYRLYGKADFLTRAMNVEGVLAGRYDNAFNSGR